MEISKWLICSILVFNSMAVFAQNDSLRSPDFKKFDTNIDNRLDTNEFRNVNAIYFQTLDTNQDKQIKMDEFFLFAFKQMDTNGNQTLDRDEWQHGRDNLFTDCMGSAKFSDYDKDGDKVLGIAEFKEAFSKTGCFNSYDSHTDGRINVKEMGDKLFQQLDVNGDGYIDKKEFEKYNPVPKR